ncbi:hypothetical protein Tco_0884581 [Tanacetum coccineum]
MATFEVLDELMETTGSTELHKRIRFWFVQEIAEEEGLLKFLRDRCDDLRRKSVRRRVLIRKMEALGEHGVADDSLECLKQTHARETAKLAGFTDVMAETALGTKRIEKGRQRFGKPTNHSKSSVKGCKGTAKLRSIEEIDPELVSYMRDNMAQCIGKAKGKFRSLEGSDPELVSCEGEFDDYDYDYDYDTTFDEGELGVVSEEPIEVKGSCELCSEREMHKSMKMMNGVCLDHKRNLLITEKVPTELNSC